MRARRVRNVGALAAVLALLTSACAYHPQNTTVVHLNDPGNCTPVDIAAAPDTAALLGDAAGRFNGSAAARLPGGACAFVRIETVDSPVALRELGTSWPDSARLGPAPVGWVPGSTMWGELLNARLADEHLPSMAPNGTPFAHTPLVVAMPAPMAGALGYPQRSIAWSDLAQLAHDPRGWGRYGHPEWGPFRLGKGNPNWSTTGLDQTIALDTAPGTTGPAATLEQSVVYYGDSTQPYFDTWKRLATKSTSRALTYLSAVITDERSVAMFDAGAAGSGAFDPHATRPKLALVAISPSDATIESDNPVIALDASWATTEARAGLRLFTKYVLLSATQSKVAATGFRPARGAVNRTALSTRNGVDPAPAAKPVAPTSPAAIERALAHWQVDRRPARVLLLFDVSDSMGDPADPTIAHGPTKLARAQIALRAALDQLAPTDQVGLRIFSTQLDGNHDWRDVVPMGTLGNRRATFDAAIAALTPQRGSPLYAATRAAFDDAAHAAAAHRIDSVVILSDGYNEDDHDTNLTALLAHLGTNPDVHVFTIAYSNDADLITLRRIAQATNATPYDARDTAVLADVFPRVLASS